MARRLRLAVALAALALLTAACQMTIDVTTLVRADGSGSFRVVFAFDKEFVDVVASSEQGRASLEQLSDVGKQFVGSGWSVSQTKPDGGLRIDISRRFDDTAELQSALREVSARAGRQTLGFASVFRNFTITHSSSWLRTSSAVSGTVDLSPERLVPGADAGAELRAALQQAARDVFRFRVRLDLPGRVGSYKGNPESVAGGTIVWSVPFGETVDFAATAGGMKPVALAALAGAIAVPAVAAVLWWWRRRRRDRAGAPPGWEMTAAGDGPAVDEHSTTNGGTS